MVVWSHEYRSAADMPDEFRAKIRGFEGI